MEIIVTVESKSFYRYFTIQLAPEKCWSLKMGLFYQNLICIMRVIMRMTSLISMQLCRMIIKRW